MRETFYYNKTIISTSLIKKIVPSNELEDVIDDFRAGKVLVTIEKKGIHLDFYSYKSIFVSWDTLNNLNFLDE